MSPDCCDWCGRSTVQLHFLQIAGGLTAVGGGALKSSIGLGRALAGTGALLFVSALLLARLRLSEGSAT